MASKKISELNTLTNANAAVSDSIPIVDADTGETKRILLGELDARYPDSVSFVQSGTYTAPELIAAGSGVGVDSVFEEVQYIEGDGGAVNVTANPQVAAGSTAGQKLELIGTSDANTVTLENGDGLALNGSCVLGDGAVLGLRWDAVAMVWRERYRNDVV